MSAPKPAVHDLSRFSHLSVTYHHLAGIVRTEHARRGWPSGDPIRILDVGCGAGTLLQFLQSALPALLPGVPFELYGLDVADSKVQPGDYFSNTVKRLSDAHPDVPWAERLALTDSASRWPYPDHHFHFILSNQVLEHVRDHVRLFENLRACLRPDGLSAHLFPVREVWWELHVKAPFAHWFREGETAASWLRLCSLLGLSTWRRYCRLVEPVALDEYVRMNRDFIAFETNYLYEEEFAKLAKLHAMRYSLRYTEEFFFNRLRRLAGKPLRYDYAPRGGVSHWLWTRLMKRINSVTLVLEKDNTYVHRGMHDPGR